MTDEERENIITGFGAEAVNLLRTQTEGVDQMRPHMSNMTRTEPLDVDTMPRMQSMPAHLIT